MPTSREPHRAHVLFDLDGTLTDSAEGIVLSLRHALSALGLPDVEAAALRRFIGPPLADTFRRLGVGDDALVRTAISHYREYFARVGWSQNRVYAGVPELLAELHARGVRLSVATSKPTVYARRILEHFGLAAHFAAIVGSELDGGRSEKAEVVREALQRRPQPPRQCVLVGDRAHDVLGARAAGIDCLAVTYGYGELDELHAASAWKLAASVEDVGRILLA